MDKKSEGVPIIGASKVSREAKPANGQNQAADQSDVRTVQTGLLIVNLAMCVHAIQSNQLALMQMKAHLHQQQVLVPPPEYEELAATVQEMIDQRNAMVHELNERFADVDERRLAKCGIESVSSNRSGNDCEGASDE